MKGRFFLLATSVLLLASLLVANLAFATVELPSVVYDGQRYYAGEEITPLRQENSKTYLMPNGNIGLDVYMGTIHYKDNYADNNEQWKDIDTTIVNGRVDKAPYILVIDYANYSITVTSKRDGSVTILQLDTLGLANKPIKVLPAVANNRATFGGVAFDTDFVIEASNERVKFKRVLLSSSASTLAKFNIIQVGNGIAITCSGRSQITGKPINVGSSKVGYTLTEWVDSAELEGVSYPIEIDPTVEVRVGASSDDCARNIGGAAGWSLVATIGEVGAEAVNKQFGMGLRFLNIAVANAETISTAYIVLESGAVTSNTVCNARVSAEDVDDAVTFVDNAAAFDARYANHTTAVVDWDNIPAWSYPEVGADTTTPEIKTVVQEIVDRGGWVSGQDMVFFIEDFDDRSDASAKRLALSWDFGDNTHGALLHIEYVVLPTVTSQAATSVEETSATLNGNITATGNGTCDERGFVYDTATHADPGNVAPGASGYASSWADAGGPWGTGAFDSGANIVGLTKGELYFFRSYTHNTKGYDYSNTERQFLTKPDEPTNLAIAITVSGQLDLTWTTGTGFDTTYIVRKVDSYPANRADGTNVYNGAGVSYNDTGLNANVDYHYSAWSYCTEGGLEQYSDLTSDAHEVALVGPITVCNTPIDISPPSLTQMYYSANVTSLVGLASYDERGFVWGTTSLATPDFTAIDATAYDSNWSETGTWNAIGTYNHTPTLVAGTTYFIRAGAHNASCWAYSAEVTFDTFDEVLWYEPNTMIIAVALPDRQGTQDGVIHWGNNTGITIVFGEMESSEATAATPDVTGGFDMPESILPETWFASGENVANLPLYDGINAVAIQIGMPVQTLYFIGIIGLAFAMMLFVIVFTRSALLGVLAMTIVLFVGSSQTIIPMWIPVVVLLVDFGIMFLYRQVSY